MDQAPMQQMPAQTSGPTSGLSQKAILTIVIVVVVLALLGWMAQAFFARNAAEFAVERALEQSGADVDVDYQGDNTWTYENDEGSVQVGENVSLPNDWPSDVPVMSGAKITYAGSSNPQTGEAGASVMFTTSQSSADVASYYQTELTKEGWTVEGTGAFGGASVISATKGDRTIGMYIVGAEGTTTVTIGVETK